MSILASEPTNSSAKSKTLDLTLFFSIFFLHLLLIFSFWRRNISVTKSSTIYSNRQAIVCHHQGPLLSFPCHLSTTSWLNWSYSWIHQLRFPISPPTSFCFYRPQPSPGSTLSQIAANQDDSPIFISESLLHHWSPIIFCQSTISNQQNTECSSCLLFQTH